MKNAYFFCDAIIASQNCICSHFQIKTVEALVTGKFQYQVIDEKTLFILSEMFLLTIYSQLELSPKTNNRF